ncbi:unnamed protein product [Rotaria magnacalcarata]|uniref:Uncharacterized protein n=1 Tax=Rotaria magnacalcarata TaxID=392030 RepID=A0A815L168_9BILA|nr:unnamed protein product [Rotaria magnacalcarata]CAF3970758.1 unnamed protein product [Rotaria magnacalcarata]CAF4007778.1 unnamed protein product [Rotaria magnacalcarata]
MENIDQNEDDERIKRLEYEHLHKIETLKRSQVPYESFKDELRSKVTTTPKLLQMNMNIVLSPSRATTNETGQRNISIWCDSNSDLLSHPTSIREDNVENRTTRLASQELSVFDDHCSVTTNTANEITSTPAVDLELNIQIQIASGSCNLYTHCDLISNSSFTIKNTSKQQQQAQTTIGSIVNINNIEYQVSRFYLPSVDVDVDAHYNSKHNNTINSALNKRASFYCRVMIQSPTSQITIHPLLLDFLEQTLEHVKLPREQEQMQTTNGQNSNNAHLNTMFLIGDQSSTASCPIDVVVSLFVFNHQFFYLHIYLLISWNVNFVCQLLIIPSSTTVENDSEQIIENSLGGLNIRPEQLQIRNALAASVQSVSFNVSRTRYTLIEREDDF